MNTLGLSGAQLHGREPLSDVRWIRKRVPFVIQGFAAGDPALAAVGNGPVDIVLVDADAPGSGTAFDWALADAVPAGGAAAARRRPQRRERRAGDPARAAVGRRRGTGVETTPGSGRKDARKLRRFIEQARAAGEQLGGDGWVPDPEAAPYDWMADGA